MMARLVAQVIGGLREDSIGNEQATMKERGQFRRGIALFNAGRFFEAHEVWEELWLDEALPEKTFLQGLIQVAAAFHHHLGGNTRGHRSLLNAGLAKLEQFPEQHRGIALAKLRTDAREWVQTPDAGGEDMSPKVPRIKMAARVGRKSKRGGSGSAAPIIFRS
jgi:hypothetical protein